MSGAVSIGIGRGRGVKKDFAVGRNGSLEMEDCMCVWEGGALGVSNYHSWRKVKKGRNRNNC